MVSRKLGAIQTSKLRGRAILGKTTVKSVKLWYSFNGSYDTRHRHSQTGGVSPITFERKTAKMRTGHGTNPWQVHTASRLNSSLCVFPVVPLLDAC